MSLSVLALKRVRLILVVVHIAASFTGLVVVLLDMATNMLSMGSMVCSL
jgi:hypothetical protein